MTGPPDTDNPDSAVQTKRTNLVAQAVDPAVDRQRDPSSSGRAFPSVNAATGFRFVYDHFDDFETSESPTCRHLVVGMRGFLDDD